MGTLLKSWKLHGIIYVTMIYARTKDLRDMIYVEKNYARNMNFQSEFCELRFLNF